MKYVLTGLEIGPSFGQLWISKQVNVSYMGESDLRVNEAEYENRNVMINCSSDYKMFTYFNLLDTDTNWNLDFTLNSVHICLVCDRRHF